MGDLIVTPGDGSGWSCDAEINTEAWLDAVTDCELTDEMDAWMSEGCEPDWDNDPNVLAFVSFREDGAEYVEAARDNVYNNENDFSSVFTFTVYAPEGVADWVGADDVYIAVCLHRGGDVRGNYERPRLFRVHSPADSGFLDWVLGWWIDPESVPEKDASEVERMNEELSVGYSSHPTSQIYDMFGGERGDWSNGTFVHEGAKAVCVPHLNVG